MSNEHELIANMKSLPEILNKKNCTIELKLKMAEQAHVRFEMELKEGIFPDLFALEDGLNAEVEFIQTVNLDKITAEDAQRTIRNLVGLMKAHTIKLRLDKREILAIMNRELEKVPSLLIDDSRPPELKIRYIISHFHVGILEQGIRKFFLPNKYILKRVFDAETKFLVNLLNGPHTQHDSAAALDLYAFIEHYKKSLFSIIKDGKVH